MSETPIYILAMGQSNALGNRSGGPTGLPGVEVWDCSGDSSSSTTGLGSQWLPAALGSAPFNTASGPINNMMAHACKTIAAMTGRPVRLVLIAMGGQSISMWSNSSGAKGALYDRMAAVLAEAGVTSVDALLWHQGEADEGSSGSYATRWGHLLSNLATDGYISATTPIVVGELAAQYSNVNPVLSSIAANDARVGLARLRHFATADNTHFTGASLVSAGTLYATTLSAIPGSEFEGMASASAAVAKKCDKQTISSGSFVKVTFPAIDWDVGGMYDPAQSRFTPPLGPVSFNLAAEFIGLSANGLGNLCLYKNGEMFRRLRFNAPASLSGTIQGWNVSFKDYASGSDYYEFYVYATGSGSLGVLASEPGTFFACYVASGLA